jgi:protein gp37
MSAATTIEWTRSDDGTPGATWNPVTGCTKVSAGCDRCYAETFAERWRGIPGHHFENGFDVTLRPERVDQPLRWKRPKRIFVNSMSDLFHESVPDAFVAEVFSVMARAHWHTFQLLTKRHGRMRSLLSRPSFRDNLAHWASWPLPNVWLGVSAEDQQWWDIRVPALLETPAALRFVSAEPLLGPTDMGLASGGPAPDWLIVGGESGPGARPMPIEWVRSMLAQCQRPGVPTVPFVKQLGSVAGRELGAGPKGGDWDKWPEDLRFRGFPVAAEAVTAS